MEPLLKDKRVFMVEDNLANKAIQTMLLERQGAKIGIERWGQNTMEHLRAFMPVDIIILDLMLPNNITGYDIFQDIRSNKEFDDIPLVAVSASNPSEAIPRARESGFSGFISKPVDFDRFPEQIAALIEGESIWVT